MKEKIDFVITWVDGNDLEWQKKKNHYLSGGNENFKNDYRTIRYRDMECLKYLFRGIASFAPWVNKIFLVTDNQIPDWLNISNEKIIIVNHEDFIPKEYLPTFNSNAIEPFFYKIKGISDKFVYFNDDMFIINKTKPTDFFMNDLPCDIMALSPLILVPEDNFHRKLCNNLEIINRYFNFNDSLSQHKKKYFSLKLDKFWIYNILFSKYNSFIGFKNFHLPISYLKSSFDKVWNVEKDILNKTASFKFRNNYESVNHWLFQYWQFAEGNFYPRNNVKFGKCINIDNQFIDKIINKSSYKVICINDKNCDENYDDLKNNLINQFEIKFPKKCIFEKE